MTSAKQTVVILNNASGSGHGSDSVAAVEAEFRRFDQTPRVNCVESEAMEKAIESALHGGADLIVIGGGDGTVSLAASVLADTNATLGVLPLGTLNHFAKDQQIPLDLAGAVRTVVTGRVSHVDVGDVDGRVFINNSSLGIYPEIVRLRQRLSVGKWLGMAAATWMVLRRGSKLSIEITSDNKTRHYRTPFVFIGNNEYKVEGLEVGQRTSMQDGQLSVYTSRLAGRLGVLRLAFKSLFRTLRAGHEFDTEIAQTLVINSPRSRLRVAIDGEVCMRDTPLHYRSRAGALRVMVPRSQTADAG